MHSIIILKEKSIPGLNPSCWQMTLASLVPNLLWHMVPQALLMQISTRPRVLLGPPASLKAPSSQLPTSVEGATR